jgi:signal transduction histidine kinase
MRDMAFDALKESPLFGGLPDDDLRELVHGGNQRSEPAGACLIAEGEIGDCLLVLLDGEIEVVRDTDEGETPLARFGPGAFVGEMALINEGPRTATVRAVTDVEILAISKAQFDHLLDRSSDICRALLRTVLSRLKSTEAMLVNQEKMAGLGRVSAGLAHELNNPASALRRSSDQLHAMLDEWQDTLLELGNVAKSSETRSQVERLKGELSAISGTEISGLTGIERADLEDSIADWLTDHGIGKSWDIAGNLAAAGWSVGRLDTLSNSIDQHELPAVISWLSSSAQIHSTLAEMRLSASRLTDIVNAVKRYSHMDRAPVARLDVNAGIDSTLVMLRHKMKGLDVSLELDASIPEIEGYPAELNQVWTNLIDNAIDAMHGQGKLTIRTSHGNGRVFIEITDDGPGIPEHLQSRLFEPFFTTKEVGSGTGLGLHITRNIVVHRHGGTLSVDSTPGKTTFSVCLPINGPREE